MLEKDREKRYASIDDVVEDIACAGLCGTEARAPRDHGRKRSVRWVIGASILCIAAAAGYWLWGRVGPPSPRGVSSLPPVPAELAIAVAPFRGVDAETESEGKVLQALVERKLRELFGSEAGVRIAAQEIAEVPQPAWGTRGRDCRAHLGDYR